MKELQTSAPIFLSYAEEDHEYCDLFKKHLSEPVRKQVLTLWSQYDIAPGEKVEDEVSFHLQQASLILLLLSPDYLANDACYQQLQQSIEIGEQEPERVCIILLRPCAWRDIWTTIVHKDYFRFLPYSGRTISHWSIPDRDDIAQEIVGEIAKLAEKRQRIQSVDDQAEGAPALIPLPEKLRNPYLALRPFGIEDEASFCGREQLTKEILDTMGGMLRTNARVDKEQRLLAIIGASGAGKSSLVHAGVLPHLIRGELAGSEAWIVLRTVYPGDHPLDNLVDVLRDHLPPEERLSVKDTLVGSTSGLGYIINDIMRHSQPRRIGSIPQGGNVLLIIDQFEECLAQSGRDECKLFIDLLVTAATKRYTPLLILMICRADFYQELMGYDVFFDLMRQHEVILNKPMTVSELRAAIETPLLKLGGAFQFEPGLVDQIIADSHGQKEALPLLQFTLFELFEHRQGLQLTRRTYQEIQGVKGALATHAEKIYASFPRWQSLIYTLFLWLVKVSIGEDQEFIVSRQLVDYEQFLAAEMAAKRVERAEIDKVVFAFIDARLLTSSLQSKRRVLEISHEILLQAWPRLTGWIRESEDILYKKQIATQDARNWRRHNRPERDLYTGQQLRQLKALQKQNLIAGDETLRDFLRKSQTRRNWQYVKQANLALIGLLLLAILGYIIGNYFLMPKNQIQVANAKDDGPGSLRDALLNASPGYTIVLDATKIGQTTLTLQHDLNFAENDDNVTLRDDGVTLVALAGQQLHIFPGISVTFEGLTIMNSQPVINQAQGGVIFNQGQLKLISCNISHNISNYNGGAVVNTGSLLLDSTVFFANRSTGYGGAIYNAGGYVEISNGSRITGNYARDGGGLYSMGGAVTIISSRIEGNIAGYSDGSRYFGGGLALRNATLTMTSSIIQENSVFGDGGGISLLDASATLNISTITNNISYLTNPSDHPAWGGGGISVDSSVAKSPTSHALMVNMPVITGSTTMSSYIGNNFSQPPAVGRFARSISDILGQRQKGLHSLSISANPDPVAIGYPPSNGQRPEILANYVGNIDVDLFCQTQNYSQGDPTPDDLSFITCISPLEATRGLPQTRQYPAVDACKDQHVSVDKQHAVARLYDYYDLSTWECYTGVEQLPYFTDHKIESSLNRFCQVYKHGAGLSKRDKPRTTAYDWQCDIDGSPTGISMADACRFLTGSPTAFERLGQFNNIEGWQCWRPLHS